MSICEAGQLDLDYNQQKKLAKVILSGKPSSLKNLLNEDRQIRAQINRAFFLPNDLCHGMTCLTYAAKEGRKATCKLLCSLGADPRARDGNGKTALEMAKNRRIRECLETLPAETEERASSVDKPPSSRPEDEPSPPRRRAEVVHLDDRPSASVSASSLLSSASSARSVSPDDDNEDEKASCLAFIASPRDKSQFKLFDDDDEIEEIRGNLLRLQPQTDEWYVTREMEEAYDRVAIRRELEKLKVILERVKAQLISDDAYFESMLSIRNQHQYKKLFATDLSYYTAWVMCMSDDEHWNTNVDKLMTRWHNVYSHSDPQPIPDVIEIYPWAVVTQNRVTATITELARRTKAMDGLYTSGQPKRLSRAWEKSAFNWNPALRYKSDIWDWSRALITYDNINQILSALRTFRDEFGGVEIINVHCTFQKADDDVDPREQKHGRRWQDVKVHFWFRQQIPHIICELQLCLAPFTNARRNLSSESGHAAYSRFRSLGEIERYVKKMKESG